MTYLARILAYLLILPCGGIAAEPEWIWNKKGDSPAHRDVCYARKQFEVPTAVTKAVLSASGDNHVVVHLNGEKVGGSDDWQQPLVADVTARLKTGGNTLAVHGRNDGGSAALIVRLALITGDKTNEVVTDGSWLVSHEAGGDWTKPGYAATGWEAPRTLGKHGIQPWGLVLGGKTASEGRQATAAERLTVPEGFQVELLRSAEAEEGSWVSMTVDPKGRLVISSQGGEPMLRYTLDASGHIAGKETIDLPVRSAMGLLHVGNALYVNGAGPNGYTLYRATDTNGDDRFETVQLIHKTEGGGGEHGTHGVVLGPDNKLYIVNGNFVRPPADLLPTSPHQHYLGDDLALPRAEDGNGFGAGEKPPGGYVMRMDLDGGHCELFAAGQRNTYDIAFNEDGELFGYDSDMEWDWGMPWYRPTRIFHIVSGAEHGFRGGSAKWPEWYQDSLPATVNTGIGSPTGVRFGTGAKYPAKYQRALFAMDWSYGRILAVHLTPTGASYGGTFESFVAGRPLNVTDLEIGSDGAMYFITGGRGTQSGLYRVSYVGKESTARVDTRNQAGVEARSLRRKLEAFHGREDAAAVATVWPHLNSPDRYIRYAARIALEFQPVATWKEKALAEKEPHAGLTALLALARIGAKETQPDIFAALKKYPMSSLSEEQQLLKLRVIEVSMARQGRPAQESIDLAVGKLLPLLPAKSEAVSRELGQVLIALEAPGVVGKALELARAASTREAQLYWIFSLRTLTNGWTRTERETWFNWFSSGGTGVTEMARPAVYAPETEQWFKDVDSNARDGSSAAGFIRNMRKAGIVSLSNRERFELASLLTQPVGPASPRSPKKPLQYVKTWQMADLENDLGSVADKARNIAKGKEAYETALCSMCHRFGDEGGAVGPDLTTISTRFARRDILDSILDPSKVVSEQFAFTSVTRKDGTQIHGRLVEDGAASLWLMQNPLAPDERVEVKKADVAKQEFSKFSPMPPGLLNMLTKEEVLDLLAYLESAGRKK